MLVGITLAILGVVCFWPGVYSLARHYFGTRTLFFEDQAITVPSPWYVDKGYLLALRRDGPLYRDVPEKIEIEYFAHGNHEDSAQYRTAWLQMRGLPENEPATGSGRPDMVIRAAMACVTISQEPGISVECLSDNTKYVARFIGRKSDSHYFFNVLDQLATRFKRK